MIVSFVPRFTRAEVIALKGFWSKAPSVSRNDDNAFSWFSRAASNFVTSWWRMSHRINLVAEGLAVTRWGSFANVQQIAWLISLPNLSRPDNSDPTPKYRNISRSDASPDNSAEYGRYVIGVGRLSHLALLLCRFQMYLWPMLRETEENLRYLYDFKK